MHQRHVYADKRIRENDVAISNIDHAPGDTHGSRSTRNISKITWCKRSRLQPIGRLVHHSRHFHVPPPEPPVPPEPPAQPAPPAPLLLLLDDELLPRLPGMHAGFVDPVGLQQMSACVLSSDFETHTRPSSQSALTLSTLHAWPSAWLEHPATFANKLTSPKPTIANVTREITVFPFARFTRVAPPSSRGLRCSSRRSHRRTNSSTARRSRWKSRATCIREVCRRARDRLDQSRRCRC